MSGFHRHRRGHTSDKIETGKKAGFSAYFSLFQAMPGKLHHWNDRGTLVLTELSPLLGYPSGIYRLLKTCKSTLGCSAWLNLYPSGIYRLLKTCKSTLAGDSFDFVPVSPVEPLPIWNL